MKTILTSTVVAVIVVMFMGLVGGDQLGSGTRFPNGISADSTSPSAGEVRGSSATTYNSSATSSAYVYSGGSSVGGQIIVEDTDGAGCSAIAALNGAVVIKSITCP